MVSWLDFRMGKNVQATVKCKVTAGKENAKRPSEKRTPRRAPSRARLAELSLRCLI